MGVCSDSAQLLDPLADSAVEVLELDDLRFECGDLGFDHAAHQSQRVSILNLEDSLSQDIGNRRHLQLPSNRCRDGSTPADVSTERFRSVERDIDTSELRDSDHQNLELSVTKAPGAGEESGVVWEGSRRCVAARARRAQLLQSRHPGGWRCRRRQEVTM